MVKDAAISVRIDESLKRQLQRDADNDGRSLASYVERIMELHSRMPVWTLKDVQPVHWKKHGPRVALPIAEGWPTATLTAEHAEALGKQLIKAAEIARKLPPN